MLPQVLDTSRLLGEQQITKHFTGKCKPTRRGLVIQEQNEPKTKKIQGLDEPRQNRPDLNPSGEGCLRAFSHLKLVYPGPNQLTSFVYLHTENSNQTKKKRCENIQSAYWPHVSKMGRKCCALEQQITQSLFLTFMFIWVIFYSLCTEHGCITPLHPRKQSTPGYGKTFSSNLHLVPQTTLELIWIETSISKGTQCGCFVHTWSVITMFTPGQRNNANGETNVAEILTNSNSYVERNRPRLSVLSHKQR